MKIMISGHGGRWQNDTKQYTVPQNVTINFFVLDGESLTNDRGVDVNAWSIYENFPDIGNIDPVETVRAGNQVYDYYCWKMVDADDGEGTSDASGIFENRETLIRPIQNEAAAERLSAIIPDLIARYPGQSIDIYWVACRTVS